WKLSVAKLCLSSFCIQRSSVAVPTLVGSSCLREVTSAARALLGGAVHVLASRDDDAPLSVTRGICCTEACADLPVVYTRTPAMPDLTVTGATQSGPRAFAMAGLAPGDVDVLELYDAFTINTILFLEDLGYCKKGEGGAFVSGGRIAPGGALPVNTNGGGLSCVHPGMYGIFTLIEGAVQLRGEAGQRQVKDAEIALC